MLQRHIFIFGLGYTALRLARALKRHGWRVSGSTRSVEKTGRFIEEGFEAVVFDGDSPLSAPDKAFSGITHMLSSIPPDDQNPSDPVLRLHLKDIAKIPTLQWLGYLSSTGVYGDTQGEWVNEQSALDFGRRLERAEADLAWQVTALAGLPVHIFRLPGIYGPGRSMIERAKEGRLSRIDKPGHVFSRIHVDDIVAAIEASIAKPNPGAVYNVADDQPAPSWEVEDYACQLLGITPPPLVALEDADLSPMARGFYAQCRRVANNRMKEELGVKLSYPSYREGLQACLEELQTS